ncbi:hypothetical protein A3850_012595 [Lewinella sp. 4G2]|nr:hypothetical protein A3850_012595 [Lewinella sp. 4G2]
MEILGMLALYRGEQFKSGRYLTDLRWAMTDLPLLVKVVLSDWGYGLQLEVRVPIIYWSEPLALGEGVEMEPEEVAISK